MSDSAYFLVLHDFTAIAKLVDGISILVFGDTVVINVLLLKETVSVILPHNGTNFFTSLDKERHRQPQVISNICASLFFPSEFVFSLNRKISENILIIAA